MTHCINSVYCCHHRDDAIISIIPGLRDYQEKRSDEKESYESIIVIILLLLIIIIIIIVVIEHSIMRIFQAVRQSS